MAKPSYMEYVNSCLRFYARYRNPSFVNEVHKANWESCDRVLSNLDETQRDIIISVYQQTGFLSESIEKVARVKGLSKKVVWNIVYDTSTKVAKERGLV